MMFEAVMRQRRGALISANSLKASGGIRGGGAAAGGLGGAALPPPPHDIRGSHDAATGCLNFWKHSKSKRGDLGGGQPPPMMFEALLIQQRGALISAHILKSCFQPCPPPHHTPRNKLIGRRHASRVCFLPGN